MNTLTLDIGNTKAKTMVWSETGPLHEEISEDVSLEIIRDLVSRYNVKNAMVSSVRGDEVQVKEKIKKIPIEKVLGINSEGITDFLIKSRYTTPIGSDRVAAYYGAESLYPSVSKLIVDAGTAITMDVVDENGVFCGGNIVLGLIGRLNALHGSTALLPKVKVDEIVLESFGKDTWNAILTGAIYGIVGEILFAAERAKKDYKIKKIILTGGDVATFAPLLKDYGLECDHDPWLVTRGLDAYLRRVNKKGCDS